MEALRSRCGGVRGGHQGPDVLPRAGRPPRAKTKEGLGARACPTTQARSTAAWRSRRRFCSRASRPISSPPRNEPRPPRPPAACASNARHGVVQCALELGVLEARRRRRRARRPGRPRARAWEPRARRGKSPRGRRRVVKEAELSMRALPRTRRKYSRRAGQRAGYVSGAETTNRPHRCIIRDLANSGSTGEERRRPRGRVAPASFFF